VKFQSFKSNIDVKFTKIVINYSMIFLIFKRNIKKNQIIIFVLFTFTGFWLSLFCLWFIKFEIY